MKPHVTCLMVSSLDGRLDSGRSGEGAAEEIRKRGEAFEAAHDELGGDGWIIGRVTAQEMSKAAAHPPETASAPPRPNHFATREGPFGVIVDRSGKVHFSKGDIGGDHVVALLGADVSDAHLAELHADGVSYVVSAEPEIDLAAALETLSRELGVKRLLLEGGGGVNGSFLKAGLVDEIVLLVWPSINGVEGARAVYEAGGEGLANDLALTLQDCEARDGVVWLRYAVRRR